ncbi:MAG: STT3 domain-containing protein, partial [Dehalococcoidales bacterium]
MNQQTDKKPEAKENRLSPGLLAGIILIVLFFGISLFLRVYLPYEQVFTGEWIKFTSVDAYFHMYLVDNIVHNFPQLTEFAPYLHYPFGIKIDNIHFYNWLLAGIIWVIGLGSPTEHTIDTVAVYFPAVLAALTVIPVYFIGKELFNRWTGVFAAGLIAILPGEYMGRSILGFTDHHVAETLFTATTMLFLILAIKTSRERGLTFNHLQSWDWVTIRKPIIYSLLAGLFLGIYLITWIGALLFVFIIAVYFFIQFIIDHLRRQSTDYLVPVGVILFLSTLIIYLLFSRSTLSWVSLVIALLIPIVLNIASRLMKSKKIRPAYYPLVVVGLGAVGVVIFFAIAPSFSQMVLSRFDIFTWSGTRTILEMQPLLSPRGEFTFQLAWGNFTTGFFLSFISLGILFYLIMKHGNAEKSLLVVWCLVILLATLGQRRFAYYFAVNVALLTGYLLWLFVKLNNENQPHARYLNIVLSTALIFFLVFFSKLHPLLVAFSVALLIVYILWQLLRVIGPWLLETPKTAAREKAKPKKIPQAGFHLTTRHVNVALAVVIILFLVFYFNIPHSVATASQTHFSPSNAWLNSLTWLKENTPEPFGDPDAYYQLYEPPPLGEKYKYPETAYGVMSWV